jgi:malonyl-CoA O-methyltransferase
MLSLSSNPPFPINPERVRQLFARRRRESFIVREIAMRTHERLDLLKLEPGLILDLGCGDEIDRPRLEARYPKARVLGLDLQPVRAARFAPSALRQLFKRTSAPWLVQGDFTALPLKAASADLIWSNCALHWVSDSDRAIAEWSRVLKPDGALLFSCLGPDSLREVRAAFEAVDQAPHVLSFTDLHDYGDMLASHGFAQPVMDMERMTLTYSNLDAFWRDVRELGGNPLVAARKGLLGKDAAARLNHALLAGRRVDGRFELSVEIITGHAWKGQVRKRADGLAVVALPTPRR